MSAVPVAEESLRAQLHSHGKLTTPRRENRKIRHENEILKANEHDPRLYKLQIYRYQKTYHKCSWDYPFKSLNVIPIGWGEETVLVQTFYKQSTTAF
jgi:hypothetical protein